MAILLKVEKDGTFAFHGRSRQPVKEKDALLLPYGKRMHYYGQVLRLYPSEKQRGILNQQIGNARFIRNQYLNQRIQVYHEEKKTLSVESYKKEQLPKLKEAYPFLKESDKFALENALLAVEDAYKNFFAKRAGFPKFASFRKPNGKKYTTNYTNHNIGLVTENGLLCVKLPKVGKIPFAMPKGFTLDTLIPQNGSIKKATITRQTDDVYEVSLLIETIVDITACAEELHIKDIVSMDLGLSFFGVIGNYEYYEKIKNPRWIKLHERRLRRLQQSLSRKQYDRKTHTGSKNWEKARKKVVKEQRKTANQRKDFHHKLSNRIAKQCDAFICEDLNIKGMIKNRKLSKAIASVGWGSFLSMLQYKMERAGKRFYKISRWFASSQLCHVCGYQNPETKDLSVRTWECPVCHTIHERDCNAQMNILKEGIQRLKEDGVAVFA